MERGARILVFLALFGVLYFVFNPSKGGERELQPIVPQNVTVPPGQRPVPRTCELWTERMRTTVSTDGGSLTSVDLLTAKYQKGTSSLDLVTTPDHPHLRPLFTDLLSGTEKDGTSLAPADVLDFTIVESTASRCVLAYEDARLKVTKAFEVGTSPYAISLALEVKNKSDATGSYALTTSTAAYLRQDQVESAMFRMNPMMSHVECVGSGGAVKRLMPDAFEPEDFEDKELFPQTALNPGDWAQPEGPSALTAVSSAYFTNALAHDGGPILPSCLVQIQERWDSVRFQNKGADPNAAALYQARLAYTKRQLGPGEKDEYRFRAFIGPKERKALAAAGNRFEPLIDLGFFSVIAKILVSFLLWVHDRVPSWGLAIVLLTLTARTLLFPLTWPSIKNMVHMRELKPEMDRLNLKYKDDAQAKGLAQMELWKKHGVNPMKGCLPQLASMPVWFALYTTLQTAVELYNIPFLWFPDLSEPDPFYVLPFVIGATYFVQQKLTPMQGGDPAQQKMMTYFMPGMFTVFMLFLPAGLGVYMFTNSLLGIGQQQLVERHAKKTLAERRAKMGDSELVQSSSTKKKKSTSRG